MKTKVTIIGAGAVGSTTAYSVLMSGLASEIVLIDVNTQKALGEALDIRQATPIVSNCNVYAGDYRDAVDSDVVVITSGLGRKPGQTRLELAQTNVNIIKSIAPQIMQYAPKALFVLVANPVDVLTYAFLKYTGLPKNQVIGSGTVLDTIRLRTRLAEIYNVSQQQVHANVLGEHGDSSFVAWSAANIAGIHLDDYNAAIANPYALTNDYTHDEVEEYVRKSGGKIIARKGCTVYGVATSVAHIIKAFKGNSETVLTVSTLMEGEYGVSDVCLSALTLVGSEGAKSVLVEKLSDEEMEKMRKSAEALKNVIASITF